MLLQLLGAVFLNLIPSAHAVDNTSILDYAGYSFTSDSLADSRGSPLSPIAGTVNWEALTSQDSNTFSPRHSHATCIFPCPDGTNKNCIWLTGGRTELYRTFDLKMEDRTADVWWSRDGRVWNKVLNLTGDFLDGIGNFDAKYGGDVAPWYSRYGHSLDALDTDGNGVSDIMVLMGGYEPVESNDIWISSNGAVWYFAGHAPWPVRAYHATLVSRGKLWVIGGTPLTNDVWSGTFIRDDEKRSGYRIRWVVEVEHGTAPFAPRCAMCAVTQVRNELARTANNETFIKKEEYMYIIGGFAGWPREDIRWNGERTRNDVWRSLDGKKWELIMPPTGENTMPFIGRGWHACTTWHDPTDTSRGVRKKLGNHINDTTDELPAKIFLSGGGYIGSKGNNEVYILEGYVDLYWSYNGSKWYRVNYEEGRAESLYSTNEWTSTLISGKYVHRGKWGHTMLSLPVDRDLDGDDTISDISINVEYCTGSQESPGRCKTGQINESESPSLFIIGGDTTDGGPSVNDVFISRPGVMCEIDGITCSGKGSCGPGVTGCVCGAEDVIGEYCDRIDESYTSGGQMLKKSCVTIITFLVLFTVTWA